jgi:hypothetical protein
MLQFSAHGGHLQTRISLESHYLPMGAIILLKFHKSFFRGE